MVLLAEGNSIKLHCLLGSVLEKENSKPKSWKTRLETLRRKTRRKLDLTSLLVGKSFGEGKLETRELYNLLRNLEKENLKPERRKL